MNWFPILLVIHIGLAIALLLPSVLLPFVLRRSGGPPGLATRALMAMQGTGTLRIGLGLAVTGAAMLLDPRSRAPHPAVAPRADALRDQPGRRGGSSAAPTCGRWSAWAGRRHDETWSPRAAAALRGPTGWRR